MKTTHIILIAAIAVAIGIIIVSAGDASTYVTFDQAYELASDGKDKKIHVVGTLKRNEFGDIVGIKPTADKISFTFIMVDESGKEQTVFYNNPVPPDFARSENIVVIGSYQEELFIADNILMKCPSKYQEDEIQAGVN